MAARRCCDGGSTTLDRSARIAATCLMLTLLQNGWGHSNISPFLTRPQQQQLREVCPAASVGWPRDAYGGAPWPRKSWNPEQAT